MFDKYVDTHIKNGTQCYKINFFMAANYTRLPKIPVLLQRLFA